MGKTRKIPVSEDIEKHCLLKQPTVSDKGALFVHQPLKFTLTIISLAQHAWCVGESLEFKQHLARLEIPAWVS